MSRPRAIHIPCARCGAPLSLDLERGAMSCAHCDHHQPLSAPILTRVRAHLDVLSVLEERGTMALEEAATYRRLGNGWLGFLSAILINVVMVGGGWLLFWTHGQLARAMGNTLAMLLIVFPVVEFVRRRLRTARREHGVDSKGQGKGWEQADCACNWYHQSHLKPNNLKFDPKAANDTHIPAPATVP